MEVEDGENEGVGARDDAAAGGEVVGGADAEGVAGGGVVGDFDGGVDEAAVGGEPVGYLGDVV